VPKVFTEEDERFLRENFRKLTNKQLAKKLDTTERSIEAKLRRLGLRRAKKKKEEIKGPAEKPEEMRKEKDKALSFYEDALAKLRRGSYAAAKKGFEKIIRVFPDLVDICNRTKVYLAVCERRISAEPFTAKTFDHHYYLGVIHSNRGEYEEALSCYQKGLKLSPENEKLLYLIAGACARLGRVKGAAENLKLAIELNPVNRIFARGDDDFDPIREKSVFVKLTSFKEKK
jgi:tetratricopeptide (TPR) repeat protein